MLAGMEIGAGGAARAKETGQEKGKEKAGPFRRDVVRDMGFSVPPSLVSAYALGLSGPKTPLLPGVVLRIRTSFFKD